MENVFPVSPILRRQFVGAAESLRAAVGPATALRADTSATGRQQRGGNAGTALRERAFRAVIVVLFGSAVLFG